MGAGWYEEGLYWEVYKKNRITVLTARKLPELNHLKECVGLYWALL